jgi:hypothetical protein
MENPQGRNADRTNNCGQLNRQAGITGARELVKHGQGAVQNPNLNNNI